MIVYVVGPCGAGKSYQTSKLKNIKVIHADRWLLKHHKRLAYKPFMWDALFYVGSVYFKSLENKYSKEFVVVDVGGGFIVSKHAEGFFKGRMCVFVSNTKAKNLYDQAVSSKPFLKATSFSSYMKSEFCPHRKRIYGNSLFKITEKQSLNNLIGIIKKYINL